MFERVWHFPKDTEGPRERRADHSISSRWLLCRRMGARGMGFFESREAEDRGSPRLKVSENNKWNYCWRNMEQREKEEKSLKMGQERGTSHPGSGRIGLQCEPSTFFCPGQQEALKVTAVSHIDYPLLTPTSSRQTDTHRHTHTALNQSVYEPTRTTEFTCCKSRTILPHQYGYVGFLPLIKAQSWTLVFLSPLLRIMTMQLEGEKLVQFQNPSRIPQCSTKKITCKFPLS